MRRSEMRGEVGGDDGEEVEDVGDRRAVEVAVGLDPAVRRDDRVVDGRRQLAAGDPRRVLDGVADATGDLRGAAQRVGVLHPGAGLGSRWLTRGSALSGHELAQVRGRQRLARLRAQRVQVGGEDVVGAEQALDAHRRRDVGDLEQQAQVGDGQDEHAEHAVGAVDEGQALLLRAARRA